MTPWILIPAHCCNALTFYQLRLCVESVLREIPRADYERVLVVDDHSTYAEEYETFRRHYSGDDRIEFLLLGEPRPSFYGALGRGVAPDGGKTSRGHGDALHDGTLALRSRGVERMLTLDSDSLILDGSCLAQATAIMDADSTIGAVGDYERGRPGVRDHLCYVDHRIEDGKAAPKSDPVEGMLNACCALWSITLYGERYLETVGRYAGEQRQIYFGNWGHAHVEVARGLWHRGLASAYHPFYRGRQVFHAGFGTLGFTRGMFADGRRTIGNVLMSPNAYAKRAEGDYYAGFLQLACSTDDYLRNLCRLFAGRHPADVNARFDRSLLVDPPWGQG